MRLTKVILGILLSLTISGLPAAGVSLLLQVTTSAQGHQTATPTAHKTNAAPLITEKVPADLRSIIDTNRDTKRVYNVIVETTRRPAQSERRMIESHGGKIKHQFQSIDSLLIEIPLAHMDELAGESSVKYITPDRKVQGEMAATAQLVGANALWSKTQSNDNDDDEEDQGSKYKAVNGKGIGIAIIDSGLSSSNRDFNKGNGSSSRIVSFKDFAGNASGQVVNGTKGRDSYDDYGHGTAVAGVAAGNGWGSRQEDGSGVEWYPGNYGDFTGIAPRADIISVKAIDNKGDSTISTVIQAIDYVISIKSKNNIKVLNLSLGTAVMQSYKTDPLCQ
ncbi:MAG: S8 family serine peptidase, partial [Acidobacteriota bacterium]|nr:S8 family serine peptidase [Acidobacteriota bacterium]